MWIITSSAWCLSSCPGGWNGTSWKRTWKQQWCSTRQQLCEPSTASVLGHETHLHFQVSWIFTCTIGEGVCFERECCPKGAAADNVQRTIPKLSWSCLPAPEGHSPGRMCSQSNGAQGTPETQSKMNNPTLDLVFTPWRSISTNSNLSTRERWFAAAFILLPF